MWILRQLIRWSMKIRLSAPKIVQLTSQSLKQLSLLIKVIKILLVLINTASVRHHVEVDDKPKSKNSSPDFQHQQCLRMNVPRLIAIQSTTNWYIVCLIHLLNPKIRKDAPVAGFLWIVDSDGRCTAHSINWFRDANAFLFWHMKYSSVSC